MSTPSDTDTRRGVVVGESAPEAAQVIAPPPETALAVHEGEDAVSTGGEAEVVQAGDQQGALLKSGVSASDAAKARWAKQRAREADETEQAIAGAAGKVVLVRTPVHVGRIIARLSKDAEKGSTQAARELRAYLEMYPAESDTDLSALDRRTRQQVIARLLAEIEEDEGALPDGPL